MEISYWQKVKYYFAQNYAAKFIALKQHYVTSVHRCDLCLQPSDKFSLLCNTCFTDLPRFDLSACQGNLLNHPQINRQLPQISFDKLIAIGPYQWPYNQWISQLKYQHRFEVGQLLAQIFAAHLTVELLTDNLPELFMPVPLHSRRLKQRQYNQAALISYKLAQLLGCKHNGAIIKRVVNTLPQVGQGGASRRRNLKHAFTLGSMATLPNHVAIVDDVLTTGATMSEICKLLTAHGVKQITVLTVCLALK